MDDMCVIGFGIAKGEEALYMAMVKALHEKGSQERLARSKQVFLGVFGEVSVADMQSVVEEIHGIAQEDAKMSFQAIPGNGLESDQVGLFIAVDGLPEW